MLKWVPVSSNREMSRAHNGYQYVVRKDGDTYTLVQKTIWGETCRHKVCTTQNAAYTLAEKWATENWANA